MTYFEENLKKALSLGKLANVQWKIKGEDPIFRPERVAVIFTDVDGKEFEMVIHNPYGDGLERQWRYEEEVVLNIIFAINHLMPEGMWIGVNGELNEVVNKVKKQFPRNPKDNEDKCLYNEWITPEYIF